MGKFKIGESRGTRIVESHTLPQRQEPCRSAGRCWSAILSNKWSAHSRPLERSIRRSLETSQTAHLLDTQAALHWHHFPDLVVDAVSPELPLLWRRASTFCKAPFKKSASSVLSATSRFSWPTFLRNSPSREFAGGFSPAPICSN